MDLPESFPQALVQFNNALQTFPLHARTLHGLEQVLAEELRTLGAREIEIGKRIVKFTGDQRLLYRANACCRTAIRILKPIHQFAAANEQQLYAGVQQIDWGEFLAPTQSLWIDPIVHSSFCTHSRYAAQLSKDAIVDQLRTAAGRRPSVERNEPDLRIGLHLVNDQATVYLDSSGDSLHKRGYRQAAGEAPLNEALAAGILRFTGWDGTAPLIDPMCGSGTFVIEAALLARNIAPILLGREFAFTKWPDFDRELFRSVYEEAKGAVRPSLDVPILGSDIDQAMVNIARENAKWAGVLDDIALDVRSFEVVQPPAAGATVVSNPPYDERLKVDRTAGLYRRIGDAMKQNFAGCTAWLLTGNLDAAKQIGLRSSERITLFNGPIECRLLKFELYAGSRKASSRSANEGAKKQPGDVSPEAPAAVDSGESSSSSPVPRKRTKDAHPAKWLEQAAMFRNRLRRMQKHTGKWARRQGITCYRLYDKDIPDIPLAIDWYEGRLHIAEYARPHDRAAAEHRAWLEFIVKSAADALEVRRRDVYLKRREKQKGAAQYEKRDDQGDFIKVREGGHTFLVNLSDYLDTGLFLDHRQTRAMVQEEAAGANFLNLFCYTGAFTVYAAAGGAATTTSVDLSNNYLDWAEANMRANGFRVSPEDPSHRFVHRDVLDFVQQASDEPPWDLAVVDPPTFSNSKQMPGVWDVQHDHAALLTRLLKRMSPGGVIYFSTNSRRFKFDPNAIETGDIREITKQTVPPDFRNKRIHRCWKLKRP